MVRKVAAAAALALAVILSGAGGFSQAATLPTGFGETTLTDGVGEHPVVVDWAPDGRMFFASKEGVVRVRNTDGTVDTLLNRRNQVNSYSDRGLLGLAVDTDFATNRYLYLLYSRELDPLNPDGPGPMTSRLARVTVKPDNTLENPADPETVILGKEGDVPCYEPDNTLDCIPADFYWHVIGTVRSDPSDGTLWVGTGDSHPPVADELSYRPYSTHSYAGKILHIDRQGNGLPDHPYCQADTDLSHVCTKIYASGFRNPYRFSLRAGQGPVVGDVGQENEEEIDLVEEGLNYGWPCYEGIDRTPIYRGEPRCAEEYEKEGTLDEATPPAWRYEHVSGSGGGAIVAGPIYEGNNYPSSYEGKLFVADYVRRWVKVLTIDADEVTDVADLATNTGPLVDLELMPNGDLAVVDPGFTGTRGIRRITYAGGNEAPEPVATATPTEGDPPLEVQFTGSASTDPEGDPLTYEWDFGDGSPRSSEDDPTHTYEDNGVYNARLTVDDGFDRFPNRTVKIKVGPNQPPAPTIDTPADESQYVTGQAVQLEGSAEDAEDGPLSSASLSWEVLLHHGSHIHQMGTFTGSDAAFQTLEDHDADSHYEIILTASDSAGETATERVLIWPTTAQLAFASDPPGAPVFYSGLGPFQAPFTRTAATGYRATIEAPDAFLLNGRSYRFKDWSDGGARKHLLRVPSADSTLLASYEREFPPDTTLDGGPAGPVRTATPSFEFSSDDSGAKFECRLDGGPYEACSSPYQTPVLNEGDHQFDVRALDPYVGTPDPSPAAKSFAVDVTAPPGVAFRGTKPGSPANENIPRILGEAEDDSSISLYGNPACFGVPLATGSAAQFAAQGLAVAVDDDSLTQVWATAADAAGNNSRCSVEAIAYREDSTAPTATIGRGPEGNTGKRRPKFGFSSDEPGSRYRCSLDRARGRDCATPMKLERVSRGKHRFCVTAIDEAGNRGSVACQRFNVVR